MEVCKVCSKWFQIESGTKEKFINPLQNFDVVDIGKVLYRPGVATYAACGKGKEEGGEHERCLLAAMKSRILLLSR